MTEPNCYMQDRNNYLTAVIAISGKTSAAVDLAGSTLIALQMPSAFSGTEISFQASYDGTTFGDFYLESSKYTIDTAASRYVHFDAKDFIGVKHIKIVAKTTQAAERTIQLICRGM